MTYICTSACYVSDARGNVTNFKPGDTIKQHQYRKLNSIQASKFTASADSVPDAHVLEAVMYHADAADILDGGYKQVWYTLQATMSDLGYDHLAPYCHTRALQIARVGRQYQAIIGSDDFNLLCPDLPAHASSWSN
jgi:hypothetical protein